MPEVSVVILSWNNLKFLEMYLPPLIEHTPQSLARIVIADNGSTDGTQLWIKKTYPGISCIEFDRNYGFTGGYNRALSEINTPYAVLMNSDIEVKPEWLPPLLDIMRNSKVAAVMPKILSMQQPGYFEYAGASGGFLDKYGYPFCRGRLFDQLEADLLQYQDAGPVFWASGACMLVRMDVFHKAGGFDERFFAHMEEIDLCWRMQLMDYQVWVNPRSEVLHVGGGSLPNESPGKILLNFRNSLLMLYKNLSKKQRRIRLMMRMILDGIAAIKYLLSGKWKLAMAILHAHIQYYKLRKIQIQQVTALPMQKLAGYYPRSIVCQYFVRSLKTYNELMAKVR